MKQIFTAQVAKYLFQNTTLQKELNFCSYCSVLVSNGVEYIEKTADRAKKSSFENTTCSVEISSTYKYHSSAVERDLGKQIFDRDRFIITRKQIRQL